MKRTFRLVLALCVAWLVPLALAAPPSTINYQGYLTSTTSGNPPISGAQVMTFRIYNSASGGVALWTETQLSVAVTNGSFNTVLGSVPASPLTLPFDVPYWLTVAINADGEMAPRQPLASSAYAFRAATLDSAATVLGSQISGTISNATLPVSPSLSGSLTLVTPSTSTTGNIMKGANPFIHNFGSGNTFAGLSAGNFTMTGSGNTGTGQSALTANAAGIQNSAFGRSALFLNTAGNNNTALGGSALTSNLTGNSNIGVGLLAGNHIVAGGFNIIIGDRGLTHADESSTIRIGESGLQTKSFIAGIRGVTPAVADALPVVIDSQGQLGTGNFGQAGASVFGTSSLTVTPATVQTVIPGLTTTITVPAGAVVLLTSVGALSTTSAVANGFSAVDVLLSTDGVAIPNGGFQRVIAANTAGVPNGMITGWSLSAVVTVAAGSHTFAVRAAGVNVAGAANATVSGDGTSPNQGTLTAVVLKL
jgi:hypothetical protein